MIMTAQDSFDTRKHHDNNQREHAPALFACWCRPTQPRLTKGSGAGQYTFTDTRHAALATKDACSQEWLDALYSLGGIADDSLASESSRAMLAMSVEFGGIEGLVADMRGLGIKLPRQGRHWVRQKLIAARKQRGRKLAAEQRHRRQQAQGESISTLDDVTLLDAPAPDWSGEPDFVRLFWLPAQRRAIDEQLAIERTGR